MKTNKVFVSSASISASTKLTTASIAAVLTTGLMAVAGPVNDHFADRIPIPGETVTVHGNNTGATRELDEPGIFHRKHNESSVWWSWKAPASGWVRIDTLGSAFDTNLAIYIGDALPEIEPVARNNNVQNFKQSLVEFQTKPGETYQVAVGSNNLNGDIELNIAFTPNSDAASEVGTDDFNRRPAMSGMDATGIGNNVFATRELDEPGIYETSKNEQTVWWSWTAPETGLVTIDTLTTTPRGVVNDFDTVLGVYEGESLESLKPVAKSNDVSPGVRSRVKFQTRAGHTYEIAAGSAYLTGNLVIRVHLDRNGDPASAVGSNLFERRPQIVATEFIGVADTTFATREVDEPGIYQAKNNERSVWWSWTAPADGPVRIDTIGTAYDCVLGVFTGESLDSLAAMAIDNNSAGNKQAIVTFEARKGKTYEIAVGSSNLSGVTRLNLAQQATINDDVSIRLAAAITFYADDGIIYQPQYSEDLFTWKDLGEEVVGAGQMVTRFMLADQMKTFFRAKKIGVGEPNSTRPDGQ